MRCSLSSLASPALLATCISLLSIACDATPLITHKLGDRDVQIISGDEELLTDEEGDLAVEKEPEIIEIPHENSTEEKEVEKEDAPDIAEEPEEFPFEFDVEEIEAKPEAETEPEPEDETETAEEIFTPDGGCCGEGLPPCEMYSKCVTIAGGSTCARECFIGGLDIRCWDGSCYNDTTGQYMKVGPGACINYGRLRECAATEEYAPRCGCCGPGLPPCKFGTACMQIEGRSVCTVFCGEWISYQLLEGETCVDYKGDCAGAWRNCPVEQQAQ